jgi:hypothetical protein
MPGRNRVPDFEGSMKVELSKAAVVERYCKFHVRLKQEQCGISTCRPPCFGTRLRERF